jgi:DNA topoisomerase-1
VPANAHTLADALSGDFTRFRDERLKPGVGVFGCNVELIVTEKDNAARRIADILSDGGASAERRNGVNVYRWGDKRCVGLSGHVVGVDFPPEYSDWRDVQPAELVDADVVKTPTQENIVATLQRLAEDADEAVIATDYDREGELIGKEAYELIEEVADIPIKRVRFSSITENEVKNAFGNPDDLDFDLAAAGEARQVIDLLWGAALTRFLSLSAKQLGDDFISVGRVQSPTLKLIVDREREIQAFDPDDYWELFADLTDGEPFEAQYFYREDGKENERVWDETAAEEAFQQLEGAREAIVDSVNRRRRTDDPPAPFDTTQYISAASSLGRSAQKAMSVAEELYTAGYITYPRTDNTVYPDDLDPEELLSEFVGHHPFGEDAESLLDVEAIEPTSGDEETTDHPPIHPTGEIPAKQDLSDDEWEVYELVVRRFFATVADPAEWEHLKVVADANGCLLKANGKRLVEAGYHDVYPYISASENYVPDVEEGEPLDVENARIEEKQTQPPRRRGQSRLIETMEDYGLGTKCLTGDTDVLVRVNGDIERRPVSELFEQEQVVLADGETDIATTSAGPRTLSYEASDGRIDHTTAELISKRSLEPDERVLEVETDAGTFSVTDDHPLYVGHDRSTIVPASDITGGDRLLTTRRSHEIDIESRETVVSWETFANDRDWTSKLYGNDCNEELLEYRNASGETQAELAVRLGTDRSYFSVYENDERDVPVWILGALGIRPDEIHGLSHDRTVENPFPLEWSSELARVLGTLLGDGSIHVNDSENVVDVRYHNTDRRLVGRFVSDIESLFGTRPTITERPGRENHHKRKYQVNLSAVTGRILLYTLDAVTVEGCPQIPDPFVPCFIGALFDDEGHISGERKAFISNVDHALLRGVQSQLAARNVETTLDTEQHKLHVRGRRNLERLLNAIPIATDETFYRGLEGLERYDVTRRKAALLELVAEQPMTTRELESELDVTRSTIQSTLRELKQDDLVTVHKEGSNRSHDSNRTIRYSTSCFRESIYSTLRGVPHTTTVRSVTERSYDGSVYDISVGGSAPNFSLEGGVIVHNSTRHNTLQKLYDRGYIESDPPRPTKLAMAVVEAAETFADRIVDDEMTAQLEDDMRAIAEGAKNYEEVTDESREMLETIFEELHDSREEIGEHLRESMKADKTLGPCPECGDDLLVRRSKRGSYFVGCDGYPDCQYTLPLPSQGEPTVLDERCAEHDLRRVKMLAGRSTYVHGCPRCKAEEAEETDDQIIGACPECGDEEGAASETPRGEGGETAEAGGELAIKQLRSGSRLVGCTRYPDCEYSLPLPRRGDIEVTDETCEEHGLPHLHILDGEDDDDPWELGCPICNYAEYRERQAVSEVEDIDGIGSKTADKLAAAGIESLDDLREADAAVVAGDVQGVSEDRIREWQAAVNVDAAAD